MKILFLGTGGIGVPALRSLRERRDCEVQAVVTQPDRPAGRHAALKPPAIKVEAELAGIPVLQPERIRNPDAIAALAAFEPDVIIVMAYGQILPRAVLDLPRLACLNLHASLLPRHRGAAPIQAAIRAGDRETGITVMHMAEGLDTGDILLTRPLPIRRRETGGSLHDRLAGLAPEALRDALDLLAAGTAPRVPQDDSLATYARQLSREDGRIQWNATAVEIDRLIRAMNPWPAAFCDIPLETAGYRRLKVFSAIVHHRESGPPGQILDIGRPGVLVAAGEGSVLLRDVQMEGRQRMPAGAWALGSRPKQGEFCR